MEAVRPRDRPQWPALPGAFGALIRVNADGSKKVLFDDLFFPGGFAFAGRDTVTVTNCGVCPGGGEILKLRV